MNAKLTKEVDDITQAISQMGGVKRALMDDIMARLPDGQIELYIEPFLGGGAAFLELARQGRIKRAILTHWQS